MKSTSEVLAHHPKCFAARDLEGLIENYSADALFFRGRTSRAGGYQGRICETIERIRKTGRID